MACITRINCLTNDRDSVILNIRGISVDIIDNETGDIHEASNKELELQRDLVLWWAIQNYNWEAEEHNE